LTVDYGQRAASREIAASASIARLLEAEHRVVRVSFLKEIGSSALTDPNTPVPSAEQGSLYDPDRSSLRAKQVWVPNRNGLFINIAACYGHARGLKKIVVGFNREEGETFPDNRADFLEACTHALSFTLDPPLQVVSPTLDLDKQEIVREGLALKAPLHLIWSCYEAGVGHCMQCESCRRLKRALLAAGVWDRFSSHLTTD
jgi:7-cyano-7-deazaguanine synthase